MNLRGLTPTYILRRLGMFVFTIWLGTTVMFVIPRLAPGDPAQAMVGRMMTEGANVENSQQLIDGWRQRFGLDDPIYLQYLKHLRNSVTFNNGYSLSFFPSQVDTLVARAMPWTIGLLAVSTFVAFLLGNAVGALLAWRGTPRLARWLLPLSLAFTAIPAFMLGLLLLYLFAFNNQWLPFAGGYARGLTPGLNMAFINSVLEHATLPALCIVLVSMGGWALGMRGMMVTLDGADYMVLAEAKGLRAATIFWRYGIRNAILPQVTALGVMLGGLAGGSILVELIFTYPGVGNLLYQAILNSDYTLIQGIVFYVIVGVSLAVLILDFIYPLVDPRINYQK